MRFAPQTTLPAAADVWWERVPAAIGWPETGALFRRGRFFDNPQTVRRRINVDY
jgi:hypothetical protein